jgi:hypothetical protein
MRAGSQCKKVSCALLELPRQFRRAHALLFWFIDSVPKARRVLPRPIKFVDALKRMLNSPTAGITAGEPKETDNEMTFEKEMNQFFIRNCYSEKERETVKARPAYQLAAEKNDPTEAQEIATQVLEGK